MDFKKPDPKDAKDAAKEAPKDAPKEAASADAEKDKVDRSKPVTKRTRVRALKLGFDGVRRRIGDVFDIEKGTYIGKWMEPVPDDTPLLTQTQADAVRAQDAARSRAPRRLGKNAADAADDDGGTADVL